MGEEIQEDDSEPAGGEDSPREGGMLKRKDEKAKPRFSKTGESLDINRDDDEERTRTGSWTKGAMPNKEDDDQSVGSTAGKTRGPRRKGGEGVAAPREPSSDSNTR